jgi:polyhydroxyalkanoate synthase
MRGEVDHEPAPGGDRQPLLDLRRMAVAGDAIGVNALGDLAEQALLTGGAAAKGYLEGRDMATTFNVLRANDLIWSFVVNNYLLGKSPFPFDLLYWNADSTRMPAAMHSFYLRNMYQENLLVKSGGITLDDVPIDL